MKREEKKNSTQMHFIMNMKYEGTEGVFVLQLDPLLNLLYLKIVGCLRCAINSFDKISKTQIIIILRVSC